MQQLIFLFLGIAYSAGIYGVDVSTRITEEQWRCLRNQSSVDFAIIRTIKSNGEFDGTAASTVKDAIDAGFAINVYFFPLFKILSANETAEAFDVGMKFFDIQPERVWLAVSGSNLWGPSKVANTLYLFELVDRLLTLGYDLGIYTSLSQWSPITGNSDLFNQFPLWYAHYETPPQPNFKDWVPFAGWDYPTMKQFRGTHVSCGVGINGNWMPF